MIVPEPALAAGGRHCANLFESQRHRELRQASALEQAPRLTEAPLLKMGEKYQGEHQGLYQDPTMGFQWNVRYFSPAERAGFEIVHRQGLFFDVAGKELNSAFDAESLAFEDALLVIDKDFRMFILVGEERGRFHHSSLVAGEDVLFAGTVAFLDGRIRLLTDSSGHYKPEPWRTPALLRELRDRGVDLSKLRVEGRAAKVYGGSVSLSPLEVQKFLLAPH